MSLLSLAFAFVLGVVITYFWAVRTVHREVVTTGHGHRRPTPPGHRLHGEPSPTPSRAGSDERPRTGRHPATPGAEPTGPSRWSDAPAVRQADRSGALESDPTDRFGRPDAVELDAASASVWIERQRPGRQSDLPAPSRPEGRTAVAPARAEGGDADPSEPEEARGREPGHDGTHGGDAADDGAGSTDWFDVVVLGVEPSVRRPDEPTGGVHRGDEDDPDDPDDTAGTTWTELPRDGEGDLDEVRDPTPGEAPHAHPGDTEHPSPLAHQFEPRRAAYPARLRDRVAPAGDGQPFIEVGRRPVWHEKQARTAAPAGTVPQHHRATSVEAWSVDGR